jgi:hypothetical protein
MDALILIVGCALIGVALGVLLLCMVALGARRERNARAHRLGRLLVISHPEWN